MPTLHAIGVATFGIASGTPAAGQIAPRRIATIVPNHTFGTAAAILSPDGRRLAYPVWKPYGIGIAIRDIRTGRVRTVKADSGIRAHLDWSPAGDRLVFADLSPERAGLWTMDATNAAERLFFVPIEGKVLYPRWLPTGGVLFVRESRTGTEFWTVGEDGFDARRLATMHPGDAWPAMSPDGTRIAYVSTRDGTPQIWVADSTGANRKRLTDSLGLASTSRPVWSPDGRGIYVSASAAYDSTLHAWFVPLDGSRPTRVDAFGDDVVEVSVTRDGSVAMARYVANVRIATLPAKGGRATPIHDSPLEQGFLPAWAPDGSLSYTAGRWRRMLFPAGFDIVRVRVDSQGRAVTPPVPVLEPAGLDFGASWSPNGRWVAFHSYRDGMDDIWVAASDSGMATAVPITQFGPNHHTSEPSWAPNNRHLIFTTFVPDETGWSRLYLVTIDSATGFPEGLPLPYQLAGFPTSVFGGRYSPDGASIAFYARTSDGRVGIFIAPSGDGPVRQIISHRSDEAYSAPAWSPDGRWLYFTTNRQRGVFEIMAVELDTGDLKTITRGTVSAIQPAVSPDGKRLAVTLWDVRTEVWLQPPN